MTFDPDDQPPVAIRRWGDACFHLVDEVTEDGYILGSVLIPKEDVLEVRELARDEQGVPVPLACTRKVFDLKLPDPPRGGVGPK